MNHVTMPDTRKTTRIRKNLVPVSSNHLENSANRSGSLKFTENDTKLGILETHLDRVVGEIRPKMAQSGVKMAIFGGWA